MSAEFFFCSRLKTIYPQAGLYLSKTRLPFQYRYFCFFSPFVDRTIQELKWMRGFSFSSRWIGGEFACLRISFSHCLYGVGGADGPYRKGFLLPSLKGRVVILTPCACHLREPNLFKFDSALSPTSLPYITRCSRGHRGGGSLVNSLLWRFISVRFIAAILIISEEKECVIFCVLSASLLLALFYRKNLFFIWVARLFLRLFFRRAVGCGTCCTVG